MRSREMLVECIFRMIVQNLLSQHISGLVFSLLPMMFRRLKGVGLLNSNQFGGHGKFQQGQV